MIALTERKKIILLLLFSGIALFVLSALSHGSGYGGGDSINHFLFSKYSWRYPHLFLNHWGKPFFILVSSPFAQFGFLGINVFNIICVCVTCWIAYRLANGWQLKNSWAAVFISLCAPVYFVCIISGLTEIFFAMVLMLSIFFLQREQFAVSAILISFLPFVRTEGFLLLPLFALALLIKRKYVHVLLLAVGTLLYSLIGYFYLHDFLWIIHQNPYAEAGTLYGHGKLNFFISQNEFILGIPLVVFFLLGLLAIITRKEKASSIELLLGLGSFVVYFVAHSIFWWKGIFGSDGLIRVMAAVTPTVTFICLHGMNYFLSFFNRYTQTKKIISVVILLLILWMPFKQHHFPRHINSGDKTVEEAATWIKNNVKGEFKIYNSHPFAFFVLDRDPFDVRMAADFYAINHDEPSTGMPAKSIVIWDSHFGPNEGGLPLQKFKENKNFKMLNSFSSETKDPEACEVYIFEKI